MIDQLVLEGLASEDSLLIQALADSLEEEGLTEQARKVREKTLKIPNYIRYKVKDEKSEEFVVFIALRDLINSLIATAKRQRNRKANRMGGILSVRPYYAPYRPLRSKEKKQRQSKNQIPTSMLPDSD